MVMNMDQDKYSEIAARYDLMRTHNPDRRDFFRRLFDEHKVWSILDCACGTGSDLLLFMSLGREVAGSDLSESMLHEARKKIDSHDLDISLTQSDFRELASQFKRDFECVVCLNNSINEIHDDSEVVKSLESMTSVLSDDGILIIDQGQTDWTMKDPPSHAPIVNDHDFSRLFVMEYKEKIMVVDIYDFVHTKHDQHFHHTQVEIAIRLKDDWIELLESAGLTDVTLYGGWDSEEYDTESSKRLIIVARKNTSE